MDDNSFFLHRGWYSQGLWNMCWRKNGNVRDQVVPHLDFSRLTSSYISFFVFRIRARCKKKLTTRWFSHNNLCTNFRWHPSIHPPQDYEYKSSCGSKEYAIDKTFYISSLMFICFTMNRIFSPWILSHSRCKHNWYILLIFTSSPHFNSLTTWGYIVSHEGVCLQNQESTFILINHRKFGFLVINFSFLLFR